MKNIELNRVTAAAVVALSVVAAAAPLSAQVTELQGIVVSASRTPLAINEVGSTVEVIDSEELARHKQSHVVDYLARLPGVSIDRSGPPGSQTGLQVRGARLAYVKVLVDGIDVSDPSATQTSPILESLLVGDVARIELLKGAQSTLYGSEAVAGVIAIETKRATDGYRATANLEYGAYKTGRASGTASYGSADGGVAFSVQGVRSDGFSAADENSGNTEADPYDNTTASGTGDYRLSDQVRIFFAARNTSADTRFDTFDNVTFLPTDDTAGNGTALEQRAGRIGADIDLFDGRFRNTIAIQAVDTERVNSGSFPNSFDGGRQKLEYQGIAEISRQLSIMAGADRDEQKASSSDDPVKRRVTIDGVFAQALVEPVENLNFTAGVRRDEHETFGQFDTYRLTAAWYVPQTGTKIRGSYGTSFRAPSLFELFSPFFGNAALQPEEGIGWDAGIDQDLFGGKVVATATYFSLDTENLIDFDFATSRFAQIAGVTERQGVELSLRAEIAPWWLLAANYTYTETEEQDGDRLPRVPAHMATLTSELRPMDDLSIVVSAKFVEDTVDLFSGNRLPLDDYVRVDAKIAYDINDNVTAYVRGENLLDDEYQTVNGFGTSDLAVYGGMSVRLGAAD